MIIQNEREVTAAVLDELAKSPDARFREVLSAFVRHLHEFAREVKLTEEEFQERLQEETDHYINCHNFANEFTL